jgi:hypothetical protein
MSVEIFPSSRFEPPLLKQHINGSRTVRIEYIIMPRQKIKIRKRGKKTHVDGKFYGWKYIFTLIYIHHTIVVYFPI